MNVNGARQRHAEFHTDPFDMSMFEEEEFDWPESALTDATVTRSVPHDNEDVEMKPVAPGTGLKASGGMRKRPTRPRMVTAKTSSPSQATKSKATNNAQSVSSSSRHALDD